MTKIDIEKFICSIRRRFGENKYISTCLDSCLKDQGLRYIDKPESGVLIRYMKEGKPIKVSKFRVGDTIRIKNSDAEYTITEISDGYYRGKGWCLDIAAGDECGDYELVEQKPTNKVEPKFKVGDIITNGKIIGKVDENENNKYHGRFGYDKDLCVHYADIPDVENWHLWTIQDVKEGDVVVDKSDGTIGIFQSIGSHPDGGCYNDPSYCFLHCHYDGKFFYADFENGNEIDSDDLVPATKEQRNLLFEKMKEAGYEWGAEKKELKKIEQKSAAWSEEDESKINGIINTLEGLYDNAASDTTKDLYRAKIYWLKLLKDRVQAWSQWKPSNEQMKILKEACVLKKSTVTGVVLCELYHDLEKLREE